MEKDIKKKEFFATSWAIDNKTSTFVIAVFIVLLGIMSYISIPKEQIPEIVIPTILVTSPYPGTSPSDIENLVTRPIEKQIKGLTGVKKITSNSVQDFSMVVVEFYTNVDVAVAKQRVKDAVDKAKSDLPNDLPRQPDVMDIDFSEFPIMYINISGDYDLVKLKKFAKDAQDKIEGLKEITRVDIVGALDREIHVDVDMYKMQAANLTFRDIENAIAYENMTITGGDIITFGMRRDIRIVGQFIDPEQIKNIVVISTNGSKSYIKDIADVKDDFAEQASFARLDKKNVITLNVIKKSGQNLLDASDKIKNIIADLKKGTYPPDLKVTLTGEQARFTRNTLEELNNTIIIGFIFVTIVLMFFMGFNNAFFVGLSVPLSMFVAYMVMPGLGFTMNMMVMFGFIFALGIVVDDAIVVIENTHRVHRTEPNIINAAKHAAGEVFLPILSGTLTTLAPFFPLAFWPGIIGKFMYFLPVTLIITLFASLFVAYIINPVFAVSFMKHEYDEKVNKIKSKQLIISSVILFAIGLIFYATGSIGLGNFMVFCMIINALYRLLIKTAIIAFQNQLWPWIMTQYERTLSFFFRNHRPAWLLGTIVALLFFTFYIVGVFKPQVLLFPNNDPNTVNVFLKLPIGTDQKVTDSLTKVVEKRIYVALGNNNPIVESVVTNVALGAGNNIFDRSSSSNLGKVSVNFVEYKYRKGDLTTTDYMNKIHDAVAGIPGVELTVEKNRMGPPTGKPVNIEISAENLEDLVHETDRYKRFLDSIHIPGVQELTSDFLNNKPEIIIDIDRERANREGISTGQIAMEVRTAVFGKEVSKYKEGEDEYPIQLKYNLSQRTNIDKILDLKITFRDMAMGGIIRQIPLSAVAKIQYTNTYGGIKRLQLKRVITLSSEVTTGHSANEVVANLGKVTEKFKPKEGVEIKYTGEREDQADTMTFLMKAMLISVGLIFFILISQFNSMFQTILILSEVLLSLIGVLLGIVIFHMSISIIMTGLGIVALGGIVVRNGILIIEFTNTSLQSGMSLKDAVLQGGLVRTKPVILTATATMLGLVPLAVGLNIDFIAMFTELNPHIHFGGDNVMFWGPLSWTIIFGLSFSTFLTLIFVPIMYFMYYNHREKRAAKRELKASV